MSDAKLWFSNNITYTGHTTLIGSHPPKYHCPKHGVVEGIGPVILSDGHGNELSRHCMKCYQELVAANCCEVTEVKP